MGDDDYEAKKLLAKLEELEREEGEIEFLEQERRKLESQEIEEGEINEEEGEIFGEEAAVFNREDGSETQEQNGIGSSTDAGLSESDAGFREENVQKTVLGLDGSDLKNEEEETVGIGQVQAFECFIPDENGVSSDMEIEEDIPSPHLMGTHVSTNFGKGALTPPVVSGAESPLLQGHSVIYSSDSTLKRKRLPDLGYNPAVQVSYEGLTRESKKKLQEALHQWAQWHTRRYPSGTGALMEPLESGTDAFSPALNLGDVGNGGVSVWMDRPTKHARKDEVKGPQIPAARKKAGEVPLYDRAFASALSSQDLSDQSDGFTPIERETARCFNCGTNTHSLPNCPQPRDMSAINAARKMHSEKKGGRAPLRYYHSSPGGQFDDIRPGELGSQVRQVLGIGEHDPPPWLQRMRDIGYPPGYLEEAEDETSEVEIFGGVGDEAGVVSGKEHNEGGEIVDKKGTGDEHTVPMKMTVRFPGINAPIPEKADKRLWTSPAETQTTQGQRLLKKGTQQQLSAGEGVESRTLQHSFSWSVIPSDPSTRDDTKPVGNSKHLFQWRPGPAPGILKTPVEYSDGWKRRDGEAGSGVRNRGHETVQALPGTNSLATEHPAMTVIRPPGVSDVLTSLPTPHIYSRQYLSQTPLLSMSAPKNPSEAWLKAQAALGVLQSDQKGVLTSEQRGFLTSEQRGFFTADQSGILQSEQRGVLKSDLRSNTSSSQQQWSRR
ncbi:hypothetical protein R1flu_016728 [Riccia fluitans]|uniref:PSP proline-rich domain-containing protein n=1 Tax=Riccia fluitans TaxID=41844 RepID=A0ABD1YMP5_9MARC